MTVSVTENAAFDVLYVKRQEPFFVHQATAGNSSGNSTFLDHPLLNDEPNAVTFVTQNWNPGGTGGSTIPARSACGIVALIISGSFLLYFPVKFWVPPYIAEKAQNRLVVPHMVAPYMGKSGDFCHK
jgi:hypothetical protein